MRLRLTHALLQLLAESAAVRVLHVKGEALHPLLAQGRPTSTDCDVLVDPSALDRFAKALAASGWEMVTTFEHGSVFEHAATFYNPAWGTADVHRRFPGLDADPQATFERLWADHEQISAGGVPIAVPDLTAQRLVMLVHAARNSGAAASPDGMRAWDGADVDSRARVEALAQELGAQVPLLIATGRAGETDGMPGARVWLALGDHADPTTVWWMRLREARGLRAKLRIMWLAAHVNPDHLALRLGRAPSRADLRREWLARIPRGSRRLWAMIRRS